MVRHEVRDTRMFRNVIFFFFFKSFSRNIFCLLDLNIVSRLVTVCLVLCFYAHLLPEQDLHLLPNRRKLAAKISRRPSAHLLFYLGALGALGAYQPTSLPTFQEVRR